LALEREYAMRTFALATFVSVLAATAARSAESPPNFVIFLADDLGYGDLACYGHPRIRTPNLDKLASQGVRLTQCYSGGAICSPSRSAILTGRTPYRNGVFTWIPDNSPMHLRASEITIATLLKRAGYSTCQSGKWHLNGGLTLDQPQPSDHGFDYWFATQNNARHLNPTSYVRNGQPVGMLQGPCAVLVADEAVGWLKTKRDRGKPFFLYVCTNEPHERVEAAPRFLKQYADLETDVAHYYGDVTQLDHAFGTIADALDELELADNTMVVFTSDNGPAGNGSSGRTRGSTGGLRGRKHDVYEGGIRVPMIVRWPGKVAPGTTSHVPVIGSDLFTTLALASGAQLPTDRTIDGADLRPALEGQPVERLQPLFWRCNIPTEGVMEMAFRQDDWKLIVNHSLTRFELYNLADDPAEATNRAPTEPIVMNRMVRDFWTHYEKICEEGYLWPDLPPWHWNAHLNRAMTGAERPNRIDRDPMPAAAGR
jgi:arylsulfatase A